MLASFYVALARKPYYAPIPGTGCDQGEATWDEDDTNTYTCGKDGLLMTQKNFQYESVVL